MTEEETISLLKKICDDISMIKKYAKFQARDAISTVLKKIATTPERQQMWRLCDGTKSTEQIASEIGVSTRSVQYFVQEADNAGLLIKEKRGYPKRIEDVFPPEWKPWKPKKVQGEKQPQPQKIETEIMEEKLDVKS